jgi:hypothetical protein
LNRFVSRIDAQPTATTIKVTFSDRDEILGAIVRALAVQVAGFQVARGMDGKYLKKKVSFASDFRIANINDSRRLCDM